jgi:hypothetical protein
LANVVLRSVGNGAPDPSELRDKKEGGLLAGRLATGNVLVGAVLGRGKAWLAGLLVAMAVAATLAGGASASEGSTMADSDGYVPVYSVCYSGTGYLGYYAWYYDGYGTVYGTVYVDDCLLADFGAGPYDRQRVIDHEMGHAYGLLHSSDPNNYMYPYYTITGT